MRPRRSRSFLIHIRTTLGEDWGAELSRTRERASSGRGGLSVARVPNRPGRGVAGAEHLPNAVVV